ncbi:uncharacterized protein LOC144435200 [Glandiceps talaboti]
MIRSKILLIIGAVWCGALADESGVRFPSGNVFVPVELTGSEAEEHEDPFNTGAQLFDSTDQEDLRLSLNYHVKDFKSSDSQYYRAHPVLFECLQKVRTAMYKEGEKVLIADGFKTKTAHEGGNTNEYLRSGSGAVLNFKSGGIGGKSMEDLVDTIVKQCINLFHGIQRDIGLILYSDKVQVHIQGADEETPYYETSGVTMTASELEERVLDLIDEVYDPAKVPGCDLTEHVLNNGDHYPTVFASDVATVGALDRHVTRDMEADFGRLIQYAGRNVEFENSERSASWCGSEDRECVDCTSGIKGSTPNSRCSDRVMSTRMNSVIRYLQKMVRDEWTDVKLKVLEAWDEPYEGQPYENGDNPADSLHYEGRAILVKLSDNDNDKLTTLASFAICSGIDYVEHKDNHLYMAVKKQYWRERRMVHFPTADLLVAEAPAEDEDVYSLPNSYSVEEKATMYLFDSDHKEERKLSNNGKIKYFTSPTSRYFRLSPSLVECYQSIITRENKGRQETDPFIDLVVERGYLTNTDQTDQIPDTDPRYNRHITGRAMQIRYNSSGELDTSVYTPMKLAKRAIHKCGPNFATKQFSMAVGLYETSVYIEVRSTFDAWVESEDLLPHGKTEAEFKDEMEKWLQRSVEGRVIDPDNPERACRHSVQPERQSCDFKHIHSEPVRRRREAGNDPNSCQPKTDTIFCKSTQGHRDIEITNMWEQIAAKHLGCGADEIKDALENCFAECGTCQTGSVWWDKQENCNNLLHWLPFDFYDKEDEVAFYVRENTDLKVPACRGHCIDMAPLFSLVAPSVERLYRPDPKRSVEEPLYSVTNNPLPVYDLMNKLYALHARGKVRVYVKDSAELTTLRGSLQMAMIFNKEVTEVEFYVADIEKIEAVTSSLENMLLEWTKSSCPDHAREYVPPFSIQELPAGVTKRSPEFALREEMLAKRKNWEKDWLKSHTLL